MRVVKGESTGNPGGATARCTLYSDEMKRRKFRVPLDQRWNLRSMRTIMSTMKMLWPDLASMGRPSRRLTWSKSIRGPTPAPTSAIAGFSETAPARNPETTCREICSLKNGRVQGIVGEPSVTEGDDAAGGFSKMPTRMNAPLKAIITRYTRAPCRAASRKKGGITC